MRVNKQTQDTLVEYLATWQLNDIVQYLKHDWLIIEDNKAVMTLKLLNEPLIPKFTIKVDTRQQKLMMLKIKLHEEVDK